RSRIGIVSIRDLHPQRKGRVRGDVVGKPPDGTSASAQTQRGRPTDTPLGARDSPAVLPGKPEGLLGPQASRLLLINTRESAGGTPAVPATVGRRGPDSPRPDRRYVGGPWRRLSSAVYFANSREPFSSQGSREDHAKQFLVRGPKMNHPMARWSV